MFVLRMGFAHHVSQDTLCLVIDASKINIKVIDATYFQVIAYAYTVKLDSIF
jgi:hypothetical protein